jgi:hypothetical protein
MDFETNTNECMYILPNMFDLICKYINRNKYPDRRENWQPLKDSFSLLLQ